MTGWSRDREVRGRGAARWLGRRLARSLPGSDPHAVERFVSRRPAEAWRRVRVEVVPDGGREVELLRGELRVEDPEAGPRRTLRLLVTRRPGHPETERTVWSNADGEVPVERLADMALARRATTAAVAGPHGSVTGPWSR